jgi:hypothetical protein
VPKRHKKRAAKKGYKLLRTGNGDRIIPPRPYKRNKRYVIVEKIVEVPVRDPGSLRAVPVPTFIQEKPSSEQNPRVVNRADYYKSHRTAKLIDF